jgi:uncharacterized protein YegP (UPF0339 family)
MYQSDINNKWYWRLKSEDSKVIADGADGHINKQDAIHAINVIRRTMATAKIYDDSVKTYV